MTQANTNPQPPQAARPPIYKRVWFWVAVAVVAVVVIAAVASGGGSSPDNDDAVSTSAGPTSTTEAEPTPAEPAPAEPPAAEPPAEVAGVGSTVDFTDGSNTGTITLNGFRRITEPEGPIGGPADNGSYLVLDFTVAATQGSVTANPLFFRAQTPDGNTFDPELGVLAQQIDSAPIPAGRQVRGEVAIDVPQGELLIDYAIFGEPLATFRITG